MKGNLDQNIRYSDSYVLGGLFYDLRGGDFFFLMRFFGSRCSCSRVEALYMGDGADQRISYWMVGILSGWGGVSCFYNCSYLFGLLEDEDCRLLKVSIDGSCEEHGV